MGATIRKLALLCLLQFIPAIAQGQDKGAIHLKTGDITPTANAADWLDNTANKAKAAPVQVLVHFTTLPTDAQRQTLAESGITLLDYIPDNTYTAIIRQSVNKAKLSSIPIHSIINTLPEWKADNYLWQKATSEKGSIRVLLSIYEGTNANEVKELITSLGGQMEHGSMEQYGYYSVVVAAGKLRNLAGWYPVRYLSPLTDIVPLDLQSIPAVKGNKAISQPSWGGYGLNGDGVTIGVGDNTSGIFHTDVRDRITNFNPAPVTNHGIHINGIAGGGALLDPLAASLAPHVSLVNFFFSNILAATGAMLQDHNMTITNNSYTVVEGDCNYFGTYDLYSRFLDTLAIQYPVVQHVFAAGNDGELTCPPHAPGYGTMGGGYQPSKNNIVVGSVTHNLEQAWDQSRGPVRDGRLKPDVVAVGASVYSCLRNNTYGWAGGTSMASPQVASGLAVLTQHYKQTHANIQPRADLLKTILLNTAMDLGNPGPDYSYGYGMMDVGRALKVIDNNQYFTANISTSATQTFTITIPSGIVQAKVMLCWNDIPASPSSSKQLINDLDLSVTTPASVQHLPLGLDGTPANVLNVGIEKADHLNNTEQVTINNPTAGTYTITVKGYNIPAGPQHFVVSYDFIPKQLELTFPLGGEQLSNTDSIRVFWNSISDGNTFSVEFSSDNGGNWLPISYSVPATNHYVGFMPSGINSGNCLVRVKRNGTSEVATSQKFAISKQTVVALAASQCPGYVNIHWSPIPNASAYEVLKKVGAYIQVTDTVTDTTYSFSNMPLRTASLVAVQPIINGLRGYRSLAVSATAGSGDCANPVSSGDLMIDRITPGTGRMLTTSAPGTSGSMFIRVKNLYATPCANYSLSYKINGNPWQTLPDAGYIAANTTSGVEISGMDFSAVGEYTVVTAVHNNETPDPVAANDTFTYTFKCLPNNAINLSTPFIDDFEAMDKFSTTHSTMGISPNGHWDYVNVDDSGSIRSFVYDEVCIGGSRSISLDQSQPMKHGSYNSLVGTFNLALYDTSTDEIRMDFDYLLHGSPSNPDGNIVNARGNEFNSWNPFYNYDLASYPGTLKQVKSLSLTDLLKRTNSNFSVSTQISFGQNDTSLIGGRNYGNGMTFDNFRLYTVASDAILDRIVSPQPNNCGLPANVPLVVKVRNGVNYTLHNIQTYYSITSDSSFVTGMGGNIDSIAAKDSITYTFPQPLYLGAGNTYKISVWLAKAGDSYTQNDSIMNYQIRNNPIITTYPYLENFENSNGGFYTGGFLSSWQYGTPASAKINKAASGTKAWKSNLTGQYNSLETSYLYSPCYDIASLANPMLSFSQSQDLEDCGGLLCDGAYVEYSFDGDTWTKLGLPGEGTNWYDSTFSIWNTIGFTRWHVASIPLPHPPTGTALHLRFVLFADPAVTFDGLAIDDIHIFDLKQSIYPANGITTIENTPSTSAWTDYTAGNKLLASVKPPQPLGNTTVTLYKHDTVSNPGQTQYTFPRSYTIASGSLPGDNTYVRLYLEESDVVAAVDDTTCPSCTRLTDAYALGITQYYNDNHTSENGTLADDITGTFVFHPYREVQWVPYDKGYRAEVNINHFSEFWFNDGGPTHNFPAGIDYLNFMAFRTGDHATTYWHSLIDTAADTYTLERSGDGKTFSTIYQKPAAHANPGEYNKPDSATITADTSLYYRLSWTMTGSSTTHYSPIRKVNYADTPLNLINFNAAMASSKSISVNWQSFIDGITDHYVLERAIGDGNYTKIDIRKAVKTYGQQYSHTDEPGNIPPGSLLHYRLTAFLDDGNTVTLPIRDVQWIDGSVVTNIYPNPTFDGAINIHWYADPGTVMDVNITDITGKVIDGTSITATQWDNTVTLQTDRLPKGVYLVRMVIGSYRHTAKIVYE